MASKRRIRLDLGVAVAEVDDFRVYYEELGDGDPLLLVNGLGCDTTTWASQLGAFSSAHRVIVFDLPGVGRTEGPAGPYTTEAFADVAAALLAHVGAPAAHVLGISMGGAVAQELALRHPARVRSLSLHATWGRADRALVALFRSWQASARAVSRLELAREVWLWVFTVWQWNDRPDDIARLEQEVLEHPYPQSPDAFCAQLEACVAHDALDRLGAIEVPVYISVGDRDHLTPAHHTYAIKERLPQARVRVWQKQAHAPYWEIPDEFNARQLEFMAAH